MFTFVKSGIVFYRRIQLLFLVPIILSSASLTAQQLSNISIKECVYGDCENGNGTMEIGTPTGKATYVGAFENSEFHGFGRLEVPISYGEKTIYAGHWRQGKRNGRGSYWNGRGNLYMGNWQDDKREGQGSYFFGLPRWEENRHTEFWLRDNTENYTGEFKNDLYQGKGTFRWANGSKYVGEFFANDKHGPGVFYYVTGNIRKQNWAYGELLPN